MPAQSLDHLFVRLGRRAEQLLEAPLHSLHDDGLVLLWPLLLWRFTHADPWG